MNTPKDPTGTHSLTTWTRPCVLSSSWTDLRSGFPEVSPSLLQRETVLAGAGGHQ